MNRNTELGIKTQYSSLCDNLEPGRFSYGCYSNSDCGSGGTCHNAGLSSSYCKYPAHKIKMSGGNKTGSSPFRESGRFSYGCYSNSDCGSGGTCHNAGLSSSYCKYPAHRIKMSGGNKTSDSPYRFSGLTVSEIQTNCASQHLPEMGPPTLQQQTAYEDCVRKMKRENRIDIVTDIFDKLFGGRDRDLQPDDNGGIPPGDTPGFDIPWGWIAGILFLLALAFVGAKAFGKNN